MVVAVTILSSVLLLSVMSGAQELGTAVLNGDVTDPKGAVVFDRSGQDVSATLCAGKHVVPGESQLGMTLDVFVNAACVRQQAVAIEAKSSTQIAAALARALDGGPREHAAQRALERLDEIRRKAVGTQKATKNAPLRNARNAAAAAAQVLLKFGANHPMPQMNPADPSTWMPFLIALLGNYQLVLGYTAHSGNALLLILALRDGELSMLFPIIALTYVWVNLLSMYFFHEQMNVWKAVGIALVISGADNRSGVIVTIAVLLVG